MRDKLKHEPEQDAISPANLQEQLATVPDSLPPPQKLRGTRIPYRPKHLLDEAYVKDLASVGYSHLEPRQLVELRALGIDAAYVRRVQARGFHNLTVEKLVETKAMGLI